MFFLEVKNHKKQIECLHNWEKKRLRQSIPQKTKQNFSETPFKKLEGIWSA